MRNYFVPSNKKAIQDHLQEVRNKNKNKVQYRKRVQDEQEAEKYLKEEIEELKRNNTVDR